MTNKILKTLTILLLIIALGFSLVYVLFKKETGSISNHPSPTPTTTEGDQAQIDKYFTQQEINFTKQYPWSHNLPIANANYFVLFESEKNLFYIELYPSKNSSLSISQQAQTLKNEVNARLQNIGVNLSQYNFEWHIYPK